MCLRVIFVGYCQIVSSEKRKQGDHGGIFVAVVFGALYAKCIENNASLSGEDQQNKENTPKNMPSGNVKARD